MYDAVGDDEASTAMVKITIGIELMGLRMEELSRQL
jgi:hypothetical protein